MERHVPAGGCCSCAPFSVLICDFQLTPAKGFENSPPFIVQSMFIEQVNDFGDNIRPRRRRRGRIPSDRRRGLTAKNRWRGRLIVRLMRRLILRPIRRLIRSRCGVTRFLNRRGERPLPLRRIPSIPLPNALTAPRALSRSNRAGRHHHGKNCANRQTRLSYSLHTAHFTLLMFYVLVSSVGQSSFSILSTQFLRR